MRELAHIHLHSDLSLSDSVSSFEEYVDLAEEKGVKAIASTEHGNAYKWIWKYHLCKAKGIKFIFGVEAYVTEQLEPKVRDNYHVILLAKNEKGRKELLTLIDISTQPDHFYYDNRITFDEFLGISDNVIKISACLGGILHKYNGDRYKELARHFDYFEIQPHPVDEQKAYNYQLYQMSLEYGTPLIAGGDIHASTPYKQECRKIQKASKKMLYANEDDYDLTFKSYDEMFNKFVECETLDDNIIHEALRNTMVVANMCEDIVLDTTTKYPYLTDNDEEILRARVNKMYIEKIKSGEIDGNDGRYVDMLREEFRVFKKINMITFMLFTSEMNEWMAENGIPTCPCRGSVGGSMLAYITGITDVDPIKHGTYFSRFANEDRTEAGD